MNEGWLCPKCQRINAPWVSHCDCARGGVNVPVQPWYPLPVYPIHPWPNVPQTGDPVPPVGPWTITWNGTGSNA